MAISLLYHIESKKTISTASRQQHTTTILLTLSTTPVVLTFRKSHSMETATLELTLFQEVTFHGNGYTWTDTDTLPGSHIPWKRLHLNWHWHSSRKSHSMETATLELTDTDTLFQNLDNRKFPVYIFLDLSKAFGTTDHNIWFKKLEHYGINGTPLIWLMYYLTERRQFDYIMSDTLTISTGVPQGSLLGPLLFTLYINYIHLASNTFKEILYADDTTLVGLLCSFKHNTNGNMHDYNTISYSINTELNHIT